MKKLVDDEPVISTPALPPRCFDKGIAGSSLVAQLLVTKCVDHNPLYRFQEQIKRYCDYDIPYSTISGWFSRGAFWLSGLVPVLQDRILKSGYFQIDESTIKVMIEPTKGKSHLGYMVQMLAPELNIVTFHYMKTRNQKNIKDLIPDFYTGRVQSDGLSLYDFLDLMESITPQTAMDMPAEDLKTLWAAMSNVRAGCLTSTKIFSPLRHLPVKTICLRKNVCSYGLRNQNH